MAYKIDNAIIKKDKKGKITLIDPSHVFDNEEAFVAIKSDDLITIQLLINGILNNDFKKWREIKSYSNDESLKTLFVHLGYSKEDVATLLKEF